MYLMVLALGVLGLLTVRAALLLLAFGMACLHFNMLDEFEKWGWFFQLLSGWGWLVGFFAAGMVLYLYFSRALAKQGWLGISWPGHGRPGSQRI